MDEAKLILSVGYHDRGHGHGDFGVIDQDGRVIAAPLDKALVDRIVLTWNCHDDLLAACEAAIDEAGGAYHARYLEMCEAAIARATA